MNNIHTVLMTVERTQPKKADAYCEADHGEMEMIVFEQHIAMWELILIIL